MKKVLFSVSALALSVLMISCGNSGNSKKSAEEQSLPEGLDLSGLSAEDLEFINEYAEELSIEEGTEEYAKLVKAFISEVDEHIDEFDEDYSDDMEDLADEMEDYAEDFADEMEDYAENLADEMEDYAENLADEMEDYAEDLEDAYDELEDEVAAALSGLGF